MIEFHEVVNGKKKIGKLFMALRTKLHSVIIKSKISRNLEILSLIYFHEENRPKNDQIIIEKLMVSAAECSAGTVKLN